MKTWPLLTLLVVAIAAGCSSPNHPASTPPPPPIPSAAGGTDQQMAQAAILNPQDVGPDYRATPFLPDSQIAARDALNACLGRPPTATHETTRVFSPMFTRDFQVIVGSIAFVDSNETARTDIAALRDAPRTGSCLRKSLTALLSSSGGSAQVTVSQIRPPPTGPDGDVVAYRLRILAQGGGHTAPFVVDTVNARKGRAEVFVDFRDENQPIPADIEHRAVRAMLDRLGAGGR